MSFLGIKSIQQRWSHNDFVGRTISNTTIPSYEWGRREDGMWPKEPPGLVPLDIVR